jgi:hypothetical protein
VLEFDPRALAEVRCQALGGAPELQPALNQLRSRADRGLLVGPLSVTDRQSPAPSGDPHDYLSLSIYYWPNPNTPDGLPYVQRDGRVNPESTDRSRYDAARLGDMVRSVSTLSLAYYLTGDDRYGVKAADLLRGWFLDPASRMNPNMTYSQIIPGNSRVRGIGIIDSREFLRVADAASLLAGSSSWTIADQAGLQSWMADLLTWLQESPNGKLEAREANNHGNWYDAQVAGLAIATGNLELARQMLTTSAPARIAAQITPDGSQPLELARTRPLHYSAFNLQALQILASLGDRVGVDLWHARGDAEGPLLRAAMDYLLPALDGDPSLVGRDVTPFNPVTELGPLLAHAASTFPDGPYGARLVQVASGADALTQLELRLGAWTL